VRALHAAFCRDAGPRDLLQLAASRIHRFGHPIVAVRAYLVDGAELALQASAGPTVDRMRIPLGDGFPAHGGEVEPDGAQSRLTVPIHRHEEILGRIEVDCAAPNGLDERARAAVRDVADGLATLL